MNPTCLHVSLLLRVPPHPGDESLDATIFGRHHAGLGLEKKDGKRSDISPKNKHGKRLVGMSGFGSFDFHANIFLSSHLLLMLGCKIR